MITTNAHLIQTGIEPTDNAEDAWAAAMAEQAAIELSGPHPPTRHCMCKECKPSFTDEFISQAEVDALLKGVMDEADDPAVQTPLTLEALMQHIKYAYYMQETLRRNAKTLMERADVYEDMAQRLGEFLPPDTTWEQVMK